VKTICAIDEIQTHARRIAAGEHETVKPGQPARFTDAAQPGDAIWQGDLCLEVVAGVPDGYTLAKKPAAQLVPGTTQGARHCLDSVRGVKVYYPQGWPASAEETLTGPCLVLSQERAVLHPTHGPVTVPAGFTVLCSYQKEYDAELRRERRNQD
jgi:hypothetical protein